MIKNLISRLTMVLINRKPAEEMFTNKKLGYYQDCYFQLFLAESRWGYRIRIK